MLHSFKVVLKQPISLVLLPTVKTRQNNIYDRPIASLLILIMGVVFLRFWTVFTV